MARAASSGLARGREEKEQEQSRPVPSGRLLLRMPGALHAELTRSAERAGVSLNQFITTALASTVGWQGEGAPPDAAHERPAQRQARWVVVALFANVAVIGLVAIAALVLLVLAWQS